MSQLSFLLTFVPHFLEKVRLKCVKAAWAKFGIEVWPGAGIGNVKDRTTISEFTDLEEEDQGGFPVNVLPGFRPVCQQHLEKTQSGLNETFQKRNPSRRTK